MSESADGNALDYDVVIVGSGFGGSVSALRLTEKVYRVCVLEAGRRFTPETLPRSSWDLRAYLWAPVLGCYGIQRTHLLGNVRVLAGAGVGGGSLNYANTLYVPPAAFSQDRQWTGITDWRQELAPCYEQAQRMLGVRTNPTVTEADEYLRETAEADGRAPQLPADTGRGLLRRRRGRRRPLHGRARRGGRGSVLRRRRDDNSLTTFLRRRRPGKGLLTAEQGHGVPNPVHIPQGWEAARHLAEQIGGFAGTNVGELTGMPLTAHFLGGCPIGADAEHGVIDPYHRLHGHPGVPVVDGSAVSANLGVNPSLTITAQAERAMSLWPKHGDPDLRPAPGEPYRRLAPVAPRRPAVPVGAFGELRLDRPQGTERPGEATPQGSGGW